MNKDSLQPEFDFDHSLPAGKEWFTPRWLARHWGRSVQHILNLIDTGAIQTGVDLTAAPAASRRNINIHRSAIVAFLTKRKL